MTAPAALRLGIASLLALGGVATAAYCYTRSRSSDTFATASTADAKATELAPPGLVGVTPIIPTSIDRPNDAALITADRAREVGAKVLGFSSFDPTSVIVVLRRAADMRDFARYAGDYPIWVISARGLFIQAYGPPAPGGPGFAPVSYRHESVFVDGMTGSVLGVQLDDSVER